jgi:uncharacterized protein (DUF885 family)
MSDFTALTAAYYRAWFRFHPEKAVDLGIEGYSHQLTPCDDDDVGALNSLNQKVLASLDEIDMEALEPAARTDAWLLYGAALLELESQAEHDWRRRDPARFVPVNAIYQLTLRQVQDLPGAMTARLTAIPGYLREARTFLRDEPEQIPAVWLEAAVTESRHGADFFRSLSHHPRLSQYRLDNELETAAREVEDFAAFLEQDIRPCASGNFACGREYFDMLLKHRHGLELDADQLHAFGQRLFEVTLEELRNETRRLQGNTDIQTLTAQIQTRHPTAGEVLSEYRAGMEVAKDFVLAQQLVDIPAIEQLKVVETPVFLRHQIPFAAYHEPAPNDPQQKGWYYVTPATSEATLGEHNRVSLRHTCVHEAWPGHHLQFVTANQNPAAATLPRLTNPSATLFEGWALYCEQLMQEQGFLDAPESRFILLKDRLWRAMRIMLDVELHTRDLGLDEAAERMQAALGFTHDQAMADLTWYTRAPTVPMGYATGWALITATRERLQGLETEFDLHGFHNRLLAEGSIALPWVLRSQYGEPLWDSVRRRVFGEDEQGKAAPRSNP